MADQHPALLAGPLKRHEEAEGAYRKAIGLNPEYALPWNNLGNLLAGPLKRREEAEGAYREAIGLDPKKSRPWQELGELLREQGRLAEAGLAYAKGNALDVAVDPYWHRRHVQVQTRLWTQSARLALQAGDLHAAREALHQLLAESVDISAAAASPHFVEEFLVPLLANASQARTVLNLLRDLGYAAAAQPLLLALEAAVEGRRDMLDVLVPEVKKAALLMYERLSRQAGTPKVPSKTASRRKSARK